MVTKVDGHIIIEGKKITFCIDEEDNNSRYLVEGTTSEYPYNEIQIMLHRVKTKDDAHTETDSRYYTEQEVSDMNIMGDNFREYLYGWDDAFVQAKGYLKKYVDMYLTHIR